MAEKTASTTSGSNARMMVGHLHSVVGLLGSTPIISGPTPRPVDGYGPLQEILDTGPRPGAYPREFLPWIANPLICNGCNCARRCSDEGGTDDRRPARGRPRAADKDDYGAGPAGVPGRRGADRPRARAGDAGRGNYARGHPRR